MPSSVIATVGGALVSSALSDDNGAEAANNAATDATRMQAQIAQDQWTRYLQWYGPMEEGFVEEAQGLGSIANQEKAATRANADVTSSYAGLRERLNRTPGANPNSQAYLQELNKIGLAEAASSAASQTGARERIADKGMQARVNALNLGKGLPGTAASGFGASAGAFASQGRYLQGQANEGAAGFAKAAGGVFQSGGFQDWLKNSRTPVALPTSSNTIGTPADLGQFL